MTAKNNTTTRGSAKKRLGVKILAVAFMVILVTSVLALVM